MHYQIFYITLQYYATVTVKLLLVTNPIFNQFPIFTDSHKRTASIYLVFSIILKIHVTNAHMIKNTAQWGNYQFKQDVIITWNRYHIYTIQKLDEIKHYLIMKDCICKLWLQYRLAT